MKKEILFEIPALYRDDFRITGYRFGEGEKSACIVGNTRGNENQQLYICAKLIQILKKLESENMIAEGREILVVPSANTYSTNTKKRFWGIDNTDINRMFPGYSEGETTQRIAGGLFEKIKDYKFGMQLASFYLSGHFMPHARVMNLGSDNSAELLEKAKDFGLPYVISHQPRPYDTATLNYNWQVWGVNAFSIYSTTTEVVDKKSAQSTVRSILCFLGKQGIIKPMGHEGFISKIVSTDDIVSVRGSRAGFFDSFVSVGEIVQKGQLLAEIIDSFEGDIIEKITSPIDGTILFARSENKMYSSTAIYKIIPTTDMF